MTEVRYRPAAEAGAWRIAVSETALAALSPTVTDLAVETVWRRVGDGGIGAIIEALTGAFGTSLSAIPPFALAVLEGDAVRVAVRGPVEVLVETGGGTEQISGAGVATWTERLVPGVRTVGIALEGAVAEPGGLPIVSGVVAATAVTLTVGGSATRRPAASAPAARSGGSAPAAPVTVPDAAGEVPVAPPVTAAPAERVAAPESTPHPEPESAPSPEPVSEPVEVATTGVDTLLPLATDAGAEPAAVADEYDLLWGETVARPISAAASIAEPDDASTDAGAGAPPESDDDAPTTAVPISAVRTATPTVPPVPSVPPVPPLPARIPVAQGDHDGETIAVADLRAMRDAQRERYESTDGVPPRRPARGRIRLSTGQSVELERPVVIGRRPKSTRTSGAELPTLVAVDSPEQDISRSHVEIHAEGEHVLVTDLDTTNGTLLVRSGQEPVRLHPGEPTMVITGDVLDIGDGVTILFEDLP
ncbi:FHA domain-containing protein [Microbacterium telephonicum]|uniref:FHA domain-containing protein n=1 Tax=Microbacterium telephonicum TaxID=1714841 RepID=A0A498CAU2_9MICO|nr:FHA domain-containing protein [Microbacterium telephonicum]RLK52377.1 FHA domain-containing protein [Microbacterium telephonicum]